MLDIIPVILGIILLIKGSFKAFGRTISRQTGRLIGSLLILPSIFTFCASAVAAYNTIRIDDSGEMTINVNDMPLDTIVTGQLAILLLALALIAYLIWKSPLTANADAAPVWGMPNPADQTAPKVSEKAKTAAPAILNTLEAAAYLRISEAELLRLIEDGKLPAARLGGNNYRIARSAIDDYVSGVL